MRRQRIEAVEDFRGTARHVHRSRLAAGQFQVDEGGDHFKRGSWKLRRGQTKTNMGAATGPSAAGTARVRSIVAAEIGKEDYAVLATGGSNGDSAFGWLNPETGSGQNAATTLSTAITPSKRAHGTVYGRHIYLTDGWRNVKRWDGRATSMVTAGIVGPSRQVGAWTPTPNQAAAGSVTAGTHLVRYRYLDSKTGYVSNPGLEVSIVAPGARSMVFAIDVAGAANILRSTDAKVDKIVVEMTVASGINFFKAAEVVQTATSVTVDLSDVSLQENLLPWLEDGHNPPPTARYAVAHRFRMWLFGQPSHTTGTVNVTNGSPSVVGVGTDWTTDALGAAGAPSRERWFFQRTGDTRYYEVSHATSATGLVLIENYAGVTGSGVTYSLFVQRDHIWISAADAPESFPTTSFLLPDESEVGGPITAGVGFGDSMLFYSSVGMFRLEWVLEPSQDGRRIVVGGGRGALSQRVVVAHEARVFALDRRGIHAFEGAFPTHISKPVDELIDTANWARKDEFHAVYLPQLRAIRWYVCLGSDQYPKDYFQYEIPEADAPVESGVWSTGKIDFAVTESRIVPTSKGLRVLLGDFYFTGLWFADEGTVEGGLAAHSHKTVAAGSTLSTINVAEGGMPTTAEGLAGCSVYWVEGNEVKRLHTNGAATLGFDAAVEQFSAVPAVGDRLWLGRVRGKLKTPAFFPRSQVGPNRFLHLFFEPLASQRFLLVRVYQDLSAAAKTDWGEKSFRSGAVRGAVQPDDGETDWEVDLSDTTGVVKIPLGTDQVRCLEVELEIKEPDTPLELTGILIDGFDVEAPT